MNINGYKDLLRAARKHVESAQDVALLNAIDAAFMPKPARLTKSEITARHQFVRANRLTIINSALLAGETYSSIGKIIGINGQTVKAIWSRGNGRPKSLAEWRAGSGR